MTSDLFVDRYRIIRQLGAGGMGVVYEAEDQLLDKIVAIKTIRKGFLSADFVLRFQREATALAALNHPNLVSLYIFGITDDNDPYMVMSLESGTPLSELIAKERLPEAKALKIFIQICDALKHCHERSVLHRDLKPSNILVRDFDSDSPFVAIIDFGIAQVEGDAIDSLTKTGMMIGTPSYMSPEQINGFHVDGQSDVYSLGCIMFECLTGLQPFRAPSALELLKRKTKEEAPKLNTVTPGFKVSQNLEEIVANCLTLQKEQRYESMSALRDDLDLFQRGKYKPVKKRKAKVEPLVETKPADRSKIIVAVVAVVGLCSALIALMMKDLISSDSDPKISIKGTDSSLIRSLPKDSTSFYNEVSGGTISLPHECSSSWAREIVLDLVKIRPVRVLKMTETDLTGSFLKDMRDIPFRTIQAKKSPIDTMGLQRMSQIRSLEEISIRTDKAISAEGLAYLKNAPNLKRLSLVDCNIDESMLSEICKIPKLTQLNVSGNQLIDDRCMEKIARELPQLEELALDKTRVTSTGLRRLLGLNLLRKLGLRSLGLTDSDLPLLSKFKGEIYVNGNDDISDEAINRSPKQPRITKSD